MGKTITTYLIDENPQGSQYSFISNEELHVLISDSKNFVEQILEKVLKANIKQ